MSLEPAAPIRLSSINSTHLSQKLRVVGRVANYNHDASLMILQDPAPKSQPPAGLFVDVSLCLDPFKSLSWTRESMGILVVMGYLEVSPTAMKISNSPSPRVDESLVLRAVIIEEREGLNIELWNDICKRFEERGEYPRI